MRRFVLLSLGLLGCTSAEAPVAEGPAAPVLLPARDATAPAAPGPYAVGVTTMEVEGPDGGAFPVEVWYPAEHPLGAEMGSYELLVGALVIAEVPSPIGAVRDAPVDYRGAPHAAVVFSHGYAATRLQSIYLTEHLASHGFVVVAPDHLGNTIRELIDTEAADLAFESLRKRPEELRRSLDAVLARSGTPGDLLEATVDEARVGVGGHSFGGLTTFRAIGGTHDPASTTAYCDATGSSFCEGWPPPAPLEPVDAEPRFRAALAQSPGGVEVFGPDGLDTVTIPVMIQGGTLDEITPHDTEAREFYARAVSPTSLVTVVDGGHYTFSDMCPMIDVLGLTVEQFDDGCSDQNLAYDVGQAIANEYAVAFFRRHLMGDERDADLLDGDRLLDHVELER